MDGGSMRSVSHTFFNRTNEFTLPWTYWVNELQISQIIQSRRNQVHLNDLILLKIVKYNYNYLKNYFLKYL